MAVDTDGHAYVALFRCQVPTQQKGGVVRIAPGGEYEIVAAGLSNPIAVRIVRHELYVLEFAVDYQPSTGRLLRMTTNVPEVILDKLNYPTAFAIAHDGAIYVTEMVAPGGGDAQSGRLLRFDPASS